MDNKKLAKFIAALGKFNDYGSTVEQTKKALDAGSTAPLRGDNDDRVIFEDTIKAINAVKQTEFSWETIIAINSEFTGDSGEQPYHAGRLRDSVLDPIRDHIYVPLWPSAAGEDVKYYPPAQIDELDLMEIVTTWDKSPKTDKDAWRMFASLAKLQPFQDGNKRTALLTINHAIGALESQDYLMPPTGRQYNQFMDNLLGFYGVGLEGDNLTEKEALEEFLKVAPARQSIQAKQLKKSRLRENSQKKNGMSR
ncbi:MAG: Fic family protein [Lactococcus hircilactis]|uniref:Fic family protein n=1 Tax=Lactococcus hircilactis TaxID=1494462 RepID=UPI003BE882CB